MDSKRQKTHHKKGDSLEESPVSSDTTLSFDVWKDLIFPFVGPGNFRFLGAVNRLFRSTYLEMYSSKTTYKQIVTVEQAQLFCQDIRDVLPNNDMECHQLSSCQVMARLGRQNVLEYFHSQNFSWNKFTCAAAAKEGHLALLQWLRHHRCPWCKDDMVYFAAAIGDIPMLQWLSTQGCYLGLNVCRSAAEHGHLNVLKWARLEKDCSWDQLTRVHAALCGHFDILKCASSLQNPCPWSTDVFQFAAMNGHLDVIKWAHLEGYPWDVLTTRAAVKYGRLDVLKFAMENGCPVDSDICENAALNGQLEILQYLFSKGFEFNGSE